MNFHLIKPVILINAFIISGCLSTSPFHIRNTEINNCLMHVSALEDSAIPPDHSDIKNCLALNEVDKAIELDTKENALTELAIEVLVTALSEI